MTGSRGKSYEDRLGDGLEIVLADGAGSLAAISERLNAIGVTGPRGERWDEAALAQELARLAAAT